MNIRGTRKNEYTSARERDTIDSRYQPKEGDLQYRPEDGAPLSKGGPVTADLSHEEYVELNDLMQQFMKDPAMPG